MTSARGTTGWSTGAGLLAILLWSTTFALARSLSEKVGPLAAGAGVYLAGGALCLLRLSFSSPGWRVRRQAWSGRYVLGCGGLFVLYTVLIYWAVGLARDREQLLEVALVNYLWPAATLLLAVPLLGQRAGWGLLPGTALALLGVVLGMTPGSQVTWRGFVQHAGAQPWAYGGTAGAAMAWALYSNLTRRWARPDAPGAVELFVPVTGVALLALSLAAGEVPHWSWPATAEAFTLGAITAVAYALWDLAMRRGDLPLVAACSYFTPLLSTLVSCAYLGIAPGSPLLAGCALVVAGSLLSWKSLSN